MCFCHYVAGLKAKEKRDRGKENIRPPTRRGAHTADQAAPAPAPHAASSYLFHPQLPSQYYIEAISNNDEIQYYVKTA